LYPSLQLPLRSENGALGDSHPHATSL